MPTRFYKAGFAVTDTPGDIKTIMANPTAPGNYMTFETPIGTDYQVPAGKTFYMTGCMIRAAGTIAIFNLGYGDTGVANGGTPPTNNKNVHGEFGEATSGASKYFDIFAAIPAEKYPYALSQNTNVHVTIYGLEI